MLAVTMCGLLLGGCQSGQDEGQDNPKLQRAKQLIEQGNFTAAFIELNKALREAPKDPHLHLNLGWLYLYTGDPDNAGKELTKVEELSPELAETYHLRGSLLSYRAQRVKNAKQAADLQEAAIQNFKKSLERNDKNDQTYFDLATSLTAVNRNEDALTVLNQGFEHIPDKDLETQVNFQIATCAARSRMQMYDEAIKDCEQALEFTTNPASRDRIEGMIENMKLMRTGQADQLETPDSAGE